MVRNNKGFSLVELMVVVAIIGILSAIAIPQVSKYMAKARQSEAKTNLASIYTANKAFFAEYGAYSGMFQVIGFAPEGQLRYNVGFTASPTVADLAPFGYNGTPGGTSTNAIAYCTTAATMTRGCQVMASAVAVTAAAATTTAFVAEGASQLITGNNVDRWRLNQNKLLSNPSNGLEAP